MAQVTSHMREHDSGFSKAIEKALRYVGGAAERYAKETISDMEAVDTGFLRNSITWALDGEPANVSEYQDDAGNQTGQYGGQAPAEEGGMKRSVYVGTNVYYAPYVEYGTRKMDARPFMSTAIQGHKSDFEELFKQAFKHFF